MECVVHGVTKYRTWLSDFHFTWLHEKYSPRKIHQAWVIVIWKTECLQSVSQSGLSVVSNYLQPHGLQHTRPPCPSPTPGVIQTHVHWVNDAVQPSHPLTSPSPPAFNLSQHQGLFQWVSQFFASGDQSVGASASTSVLPMNIQDWFPLGWTGWISLQFKGLSRVFSNTTAQKHQFFDTQLSLWFNSHTHTWLLEKPQLWLDGLLLVK